MTTGLVIVLPIAAFLNAYVYPNLLRASHACTAPNPLSRLAPVVLQAVQAVLAAVLATLLLEAIVSSPHLDFRLDAQWDALFAARDAHAIELVQDAFDCCGFDAVSDRACPFNATRTCALEYGRDRACAAPWKSAMRATCALDFAVVVAVGLLQVGHPGNGRLSIADGALQILGLLLMRERTAWWTALRTPAWKQGEFGHGSNQHLLSDSGSETASCSSRTCSGYGALPCGKPGPKGHDETNAE